MILSHQSRQRVSHLLLLAGFTYASLPLVVDLEVWSRIIFQAIATLVLGIWLIRRIRQRKGLPATLLDLPLAFLLLAYVIATLAAQDRRIALEGLWLVVIHTLLFYACVDVIRQRGPAALLEPLLFAAAVNILIGLVEMIAWYFGLPVLGGFHQGWPQIGGLRDPIPPLIHRLTVPLSVSTWLAVYLITLIPIGVAWLLASQRRQTRLGLALWLTGALVIEGLTFSRGGLLALVVAAGVFGGLLLVQSPDVMRGLRRRLADWRMLALLAIVVLVVAALAWGWSTQNFLGHRAGDQQRWDMWRSALSMIRDYPLTGSGVGNFGRILRIYRNPHLTGDHMTSPHNVPLYLGAEVGIPGLLAGVAVIGVLIWAALRRWREAAGADRIRLAGVLAALAGFAVYNLFDNFLATPVLLPALVLAAVVISPYQAFSAGRRVRQGAALASAAVLVLSAIGWGFSDAAQLAFQRSQRLQAEGDPQAALAAIDRAIAIDPALGLYHLQRAQYLGEDVVTDPAYLPQALQAYDRALEFEDTYDVNLANEALLLARSGDLPEARRLLEQAAATAPFRTEYILWQADLAEQMDDLAAAQAGYQAYLDREHETAGSAYWLQTPVRLQVREAYLQSFIERGFSRAEVLRLPAECLQQPPAASSSASCAGLVALRLDGDPQAAVARFDQAIDSAPQQPDLYVLRAEAWLEANDLRGAERDARTAVFLGDATGYLVLGQIAEQAGDLTAAESAYQQSGPGIVQYQGWEVAVYHRRGSFYLLPLLDTPGVSPRAVAGWQALADLLEQQGRHSDAAFVRSVLERFALYDYED